MGRPRGGQNKRILTPAELGQLEQLAGLRLPMKQIASLFYMHLATFERLVARDQNVAAIMERGRSTSSTKIRKTLYQMAVGDPGDPEKGIEPTKPDFQALKFWCQTQEHFVSADRLEISGPKGGPLHVKAALETPEDRRAKLEWLAETLQLTNDKDQPIETTSSPVEAGTVVSGTGLPTNDPQGTA